MSRKLAFEVLEQRHLLSGMEYPAAVVRVDYDLRSSNQVLFEPPKASPVDTSYEEASQAESVPVNVSMAVGVMRPYGGPGRQPLSGWTDAYAAIELTGSFTGQATGSATVNTVMVGGQVAGWVQNTAIVSSNVGIRQTEARIVLQGNGDINLSGEIVVYSRDSADYFANGVRELVRFREYVGFNFSLVASGAFNITIAAIAGRDQWKEFLISSQGVFCIASDVDRSFAQGQLAVTAADGYSGQVGMNVLTNQIYYRSERGLTPVLAVSNVSGQIAGSIGGAGSLRLDLQAARPHFVGQFPEVAVNYHKARAIVTSAGQTQFSGQVALTADGDGKLVTQSAGLSGAMSLEAYVAGNTNDPIGYYDIVLATLYNVRDDLFFV